MDRYSALKATTVTGVTRELFAPPSWPRRIGRASRLRKATKTACKTKWGRGVPSWHASVPICRELEALGPSLVAVGGGVGLCFSWPGGARSNRRSGFAGVVRFVVRGMGVCPHRRLWMRPCAPRAPSNSEAARSSTCQRAPRTRCTPIVSPSKYGLGRCSLRIVRRCARLPPRWALSSLLGLAQEFA